MTAEPDLLPLPHPTGNQIVMRGDDFQGDYNFYVSAFTGDQLESYARANVAHAVAPLQAEIDALRTRLEDTVRDSTNKIEALRAEVAEWKRVAAAQAELHGAAEARAERLAEALRHSRWCRTCAEDGWESCEDGSKNDALLREQEEGRG